MDPVLLQAGETRHPWCTEQGLADCARLRQRIAADRLAETKPSPGLPRHTVTEEIR